MADVDQTALQRRATWVGLRTLRQRPKMVGDTPGGEPVFEVKSVRLILREGAGHFSRLAQCSKCGREVPGAPVMTPADLDRPAHSVICKDCVRASGVARPLQAERRAPKAEPSPAPPEEKAPEKQAEPVEDVRLAAVEVQLQAAMSRLAELADVDRVEAAEARVQEALRQGLAEIRAELLASSERASAEPAVDEEVRNRTNTLTDVVKAQQGRLVSLSAVVDEVRTEVQRLVSWNQEVARAQADLERRIDEAATKTSVEAAALEQRLRTDISNLAQRVEDAPARDDLERRIGAAVAEVGAETAALRADITSLSHLVEAAPVRADLERRIDEAAAEVATQTTVIEQRLRGDVTTLGQLVEQLRADLESTLGAPVATGMTQVIEAIHELARSRDEIKAGADVRMEAISSAVEDGGSRLRDLEIRMDRAIDRLTAALEDHRLELKEVTAATYRLDHDTDLGAPEESPSGQLVDGLEQQLRRAESRLARLTAGPNGGTGQAAGR